MDCHRVVAVARSFDVYAPQPRRIGIADHVGRIDVLPGVVGWIVGFPVRLGRYDGIHQLAGGEGAGQIVAGLRLGKGPPALHRAIFVGDGDAKVLGVFDYRREDLAVERKILLEAAVLAAKAGIVADERPGHHIRPVAAQQVGDADQAEQMVAVGHRFPLVVCEEILVGADGDAEIVFAADVDNLLRVLCGEMLVVEVGGHVVLAGAVAPEDAQFETLRAKSARLLHHSGEVEFRVCGSHQPDRVVHVCNLLLHPLSHKRSWPSNRSEKIFLVENLQIWDNFQRFRYRGFRVPCIAENTLLEMAWRSRLGKTRSAPRRPSPHN